MTKWNYRVMRHSDAFGREHFIIHETYYDDNGNVTGWTEEPSEVLSETRDGIRDELERMLRALDYPVTEVSHGTVQDGGCGND